MNFGYIVVSFYSRNILSKFTILISLIIISSHLHAQIDIKSKVDAQTYSEYSKAIDLIEKSVHSNNVITFFIPTNFSFRRLSQEKQTALLNSDLSEISQFISNHSSSSLIDSNYLSSNFNSNISLNNFELLNNKKIYFQKDGNRFLLGDNFSPTLVTYESYLVKSIKFSDKIFLCFLDGIFLY